MHKINNSPTTFRKRYSRAVDFLNNFSTTSSDGHGTIIKVVHLEKLDNFVVQFFFDLKPFCQRKVGLNFINLKFEYFKKYLRRETTKMKVIYLESIRNYLVDNLFV